MRWSDAARVRFGCGVACFARADADAADDAHTFTVFVKQLKTGLFAALDDERRQQLAKALLKIGVTTTSSVRARLCRVG